MAIKLPNGKISRTLPEQVGYLSDKLKELETSFGSLQAVVEAAEIDDRIFNITSDQLTRNSAYNYSGTLTAAQLAIAKKETAVATVSKELEISEDEQIIVYKCEDEQARNDRVVFASPVSLAIVNNVITISYFQLVVSTNSGHFDFERILTRAAEEPDENCFLLKGYINIYDETYSVYTGNVIGIRGLFAVNYADDFDENDPLRNFKGTTFILDLQRGEDDFCVGYFTDNNKIIKISGTCEEILLESIEDYGIESVNLNTGEMTTYEF